MQVRDVFGSVALVALFIGASACQGDGSSGGYLDAPREHAVEDAPASKADLPLPGTSSRPDPAPATDKAASTTNSLAAPVPPAPAEAREPTDGPDLVPPACAHAADATPAVAGARYVCDVELDDGVTRYYWHCALTPAHPHLRLHAGAYAFAEMADGHLRAVVNADSQLAYQSFHRAQITVDIGANTPRLWRQNRDPDRDAVLECRFVGG